MYMYWLDLVGVFAFAFLGAKFAIDQKLNGLGIVACGFLTAVGGGTIREIILGRTPFYFYDHTYLVVILIGAGASKLLYRRSETVQSAILLLDAVGMVTFASLGAAAATQAQLGLFGSVFFALLTACGGGALCETIAGTTPRVFRHTFYAIPPCLLGAAYWAAGNAAHQPGIQLSLMASALTLQVMALYSNRTATLLRPLARTSASPLRTYLGQLTRLLGLKKINTLEAEE